MVEQGKSIWIISKYANLPEDELGTSRVFGFANSFAKKGYSVKLIGSRSNGSPHIPKQKKRTQKTQYHSLEFIRINGPIIKLGFSIKRIWSWVLFEWYLWLFLRKQKEAPEVVLVSSLSLLSILNGIYLKKKHHSRLIFEVRDIWPLSLVELSSLSYKNPFVKVLAYLEAKAYKNADHIVGSMPNLKSHVETIIGNSDKVSHIPMAFEERFYKKKDALDEVMLKQIPKDKFIFGYAGSIGNANALEIMFKAFIKLNNPHTALVVLGGGPLLNHYKEKYTQNNIVFLGKTQKEKVQDFLTYCDVLVNTWHHSKIYEYGVSPNKWIDYMYAAKPIIVSYSGYHSIINEAQCGEFVTAGDVDALAIIMKEYKEKTKMELNTMGENGKKYLSKYLSYAHLSEKYLDILFEQQ